MRAQGNINMKPPKKRTPKASKKVAQPQPVDVTRADLQPIRALGRSLSDFEPLMIAERALLQACRIGGIAVISEQRPGQSTEENTVRAGFLRFLLLGGDQSTPLHEQGVRLMGAWIEGELNLENTRTVSAIDCIACTFTKLLMLRSSILPSGLFLTWSEVPGIQGDGLVTTGDVFLNDGFKATGEVRLLGAQIGGSLDCDKGQFDGNGGNALSADGALIKSAVFLRDGFKATGTVRLLGAQIGGSLECDKGQFDGNGGNALYADRALTKGGVFLRDGFQAKGTVRLLGAQIGDSLECGKGQFDGSGVHALIADGAVIKGSVLCDGVQAMGTVRLLGAQIDGSLICDKGRFDGNGGDALIADGAVIKGAVFLRDGFQATGTVRLVGAQIGGDLVCNKGQFDINGDLALAASGMRVAGRFFFRNLASPVSKLSLAATSVGVLVDDGDAWGSDLVLDGFTYGGIGGKSPPNADERLAWLDKQQPAMSGQSADGKNFRPQPWRQLQKVLREMGHAEDARQVAIAFEDRLRHADLIGLSPQHWWRGRKWLYRASARSFHFGFRILTGYGYRPIRLLGWFTGMWLACAAFYWFAALPPNNVFAPSNPLVFQNEDYAACVPGSPAARAEKAKPADAKPSPVKGAGNWYLCEKLRAEYTGFSPLAYSLDVILPLVDLQQQKDWAPMIPTPKPSPWDELRGSGWKHITRMVLWAETLFG